MNKSSPTIYPSPLMGEDQSLSQCLTLGPESENDASHRPAIADLIRNPEGQCHGAAVILALRQYPQGGVTTRQHQPSSPSPLMGEETKACPSA